jgi:hypothetical protein
MAALRLSLLSALLLISAANARTLLQEEPRENGGSVNVPQWNVTVSADSQDRRSVLGIGQSSDVSVTFYNTPGTMDCTDGENRLPIFFSFHVLVVA